MADAIAASSPRFAARRNAEAAFQTMFFFLRSIDLPLRQ
jgi:hypothetical protein